MDWFTGMMLAVILGTLICTLLGMLGQDSCRRKEYQAVSNKLKTAEDMV